MTAEDVLHSPLKAHVLENMATVSLPEGGMVVWYENKIHKEHDRKKLLKAETHFWFHLNLLAAFDGLCFWKKTFFFI